MNAGNHTYLVLGIVLISIIPSIITGLFMRVICDLFTTDVRFSGVALGYNIAFAFVGGIAPLSIEIMIKDINVVAGPAIVSMTCAALGLLAMYLIKTPQKIKV
nr:hypothetical protein [Piscirickettsia litoralis]